VEDLNTKIVNYFQRFFKNNQVNTATRVIDLGFESMDYLQLSAFIFNTTGCWFDISKINNDTRISDISSFIFKLEQDKSIHKIMVKLDVYQRYAYSYQFKDKCNLYVISFISYLYLKEPVDIPKLKQAIADTLNNHYMLNSKLTRIIDDYYFERTPIQSDFIFKGSLFFPKRDLSRLMINVHSDRLVNIYVQRKKKHYYLILAFQHIALDEWSQKIVQEEIFRRYAGLYNAPKKNVDEDIPALCTIYTASISEQSNTDELRALYNKIDPYEYGHLDQMFYGKPQRNQSNFVITKEELEQYVKINHIDGFPNSVIFAFIFHQMVRQISGVDKLIFYTSLSNRHLPISKINELVGNLPNCLPLFLNSKNLDSTQFAATIHESLKICFKHMSYGAVIRMILENNKLLNDFMSPARQPYTLLYSYINNISKTIYGNDSITSNYVDWNKSKTYICIKRNRNLTFDVHNLGSEFYIHIRSQMVNNIHHTMVHDFLKSNFPDVLLKI